MKTDARTLPDDPVARGDLQRVVALLPRRDSDRLAALARRHGTSISALIRRLVHSYVEADE